MTAPIIAITTWRRKLPTYLDPHTDLYTLGAEYAETVAAAGGVPILLPELDSKAVAWVLDRVDGVLLSGGQDLGLPDAADSARDATEFALLREAGRRRLPVLGICRGLQAINVFLGGTLVDDLPDTVAHPHLASDSDQAATRHVITSTAPWVLTALPASAEVNSIHHQAIDRLAPDLEDVAWSADGVIEAVEGRDTDWFIRAVQWHPEKLPGVEGRAHATRILADFIATSSERALTST
jgi:putative glutamine amidotransferase